MNNKSQKMIALGLASTALFGAIGNNAFLINSIAEGNETIDSDINTLAVAPNSPSINVKDNMVSLLDNGVSATITDDFKSTSPFKYSNSNWRTTGGYMRSEMIGHGESTENSFEVKAKDGDVLNIQGTISSEDNYDLGSIMINGEVVYEGSGSRVPFNVNLELREGTHNIVFKYEKDASGSEYEDCMNINKISLTSKTNSKELKYRIDGGSWKTYTSQFALDFNAKESYLIEAKAVGSDGSESSVSSRTVKKAPVEIQSPEIVSKLKGFSLKDNGVKTYSVRDNFDGSKNITYSNNKWTIGSGKMVSQSVGFGETTQNKFTINADEGDVLNIKGLINSDLNTEVGRIYLDGNVIYSSKATKGFNFEYELPQGNHEVTLEYVGTYGNQSVNSMVINEISVATKLNNDKIQYRIDGGSWKDYTTPVALDYNSKNSYIVETRAVYKNENSAIANKTLNKRNGTVNTPTMSITDNKLTLVDNGYRGIVMYDDFTFNSDFKYNNSDWKVQNNQFKAPTLSRNWDSTLVEFEVNLSEMSTLKILGSQNSKDVNDKFALYVDNLPVTSMNNSSIDIETDVYEGKHKIGLEFSKNSAITYNFNGIIDLIQFEGSSDSKELQYKVNNGAWTKYNGGEVDLNLQTGSNTIYAKAIGMDGTESSITQQVVNVEGENPNPDPEPPVNPPSETKTENLGVTVKSRNTLEMALSTNQITFGDYNGTGDLTNEDLNITVTSGLNYDLSATMTDDLRSDRGDIMNSNLLNIKESSKDFDVFSNIGDKLFLVQNSPAGRDNIHNIHFKLIGDSSVKAGNYSTTIQFEAQQK